MEPCKATGSSAAKAINDFGTVVGDSYPSYSSRPAVWGNDPAHTAYELPLLPEDNYGTTAAINNLGQVIGWSGTNESGAGNVGTGNPVVWRDGGVYDLQAALDPATGAGWILNGVSAFNNAG